MNSEDRNRVGYLEALEEAKKQYREYLEICKIFELPTFEEEEPVEYEPPSPERPLTISRFDVKRNGFSGTAGRRPVRMR